MRIQHNIAAMNSYRNYSNNVSAVNKNLEKLSSGYKINRAGDDAAGLAISEKMRAQIKGLEAAQKNVKDGVSLVKTAEGAMQEIQDMLSRMKYLATQSANGTYDNDVDRANLQAEVEQLNSEINRIADSSNFNGIKLLDGSLAGNGGAANVDSSATATAVAATKQKDTYTAATVTLAAGDKYEVTFNYKDGFGQTQSKVFNFTVNAAGDKLVNEKGTEYADLKAALKGEVERTGITNLTTADGLVYEAAEAGADKGQVLSIDVVKNGVAVKGGVITNNEVGKDAATTYSGFTAYEGSAGQKAENFVFTVNGHKFAFAKTGATGAFGGDVTVITTAAASPADAEVKNMVDSINRVVGSDVATQNETTKTSIDFATGDTSGSAGGLKLQIGDTADSYNQLNVIVGDMHTSALGIDGVDIGSQTGAQSAIETIKNAINRVSSVRGTLGATQNRLEHTANNLSVMTENIQDAESTIRDTDIAEEMMSYTKNNILVQSAQAMLAQANQIPQGVLQLLG